MRRFLIGYLAVAVAAVLMVAVLPLALRGTPEAPAAVAQPAGVTATVATAPAAVAAAPAPGSVADLTSAILADLTASAPAPAAADPADPLAAMSAGVLAALNERRPGAALAADPALAQLVAKAVAQGQSPSYIDVLVNEAAAMGAVEVPAGMRRTDGRVDTTALLAMLDPHGEFGEGDVSAADLATDPVSQALDTGPATYVVLPGDSLSAIALRYYGDAGRYAEIHAANTAILPSPNGLRAGQELVLPAR